MRFTFSMFYSCNELSHLTYDMRYNKLIRQITKALFLHTQELCCKYHFWQACSK